MFYKSRMFKQNKCTTYSKLWISINLKPIPIISELFKLLKFLVDKNRVIFVFIFSISCYFF